MESTGKHVSKRPRVTGIPKAPKEGVNYCGYLLNQKAVEKYQVALRSQGGAAQGLQEVKEKRCKMEKKVGKQYCPQHEIVAFIEQQKASVGKEKDPGGTQQAQVQGSGEGSGGSGDGQVPDFMNERVQCPYLPPHFVMKKRLKNHVARCNFRPLADDFFHLNLHLDPPTQANTSTSTAAAVPPVVAPSGKPRLLQSLPQARLLEMVEKVEKIAAQLEAQEPVVERIMSHPGMEQEIREGTEKTIKHLAQESSLLGNMERLGLLDPTRCFLEFGAGRGGLSRAIYSGLGDKGNQATFLLVDRAGSRKKVDTKLKASVDHVSRIRIDIKDLDLTKVKQVRHKHLVVVGKHLCGGGTDVSLRCAIHLCEHEKAQPEGESGQRRENPVEGFAIALCCHHRCTWNSYVNKPFLIEFGINQAEFEILLKLSTWATCGTRRKGTNGSEDGDSEEEEDEDEEGEGDEDGHFDVEEEEDGDQEPRAKRPRIEEKHYSGLTYEHRVRIGKACKYILNVGRKRYLAEKGYASELVRFTTHSLENIALLAAAKTAEGDFSHDPSGAVNDAHTHARPERQ